MYPFGSTKPLQVNDVFTVEFKATEGSEPVNAKLQVIDEAQICVLGGKTAVKLGLLHIDPIDQVNAIQPEETDRFHS